MGVLKTLSNGQVLALLDPDDLGDDGDVLTRVGGSGAAFRPGGGGEAVWGGITGTLSAQTDLQAALDAVTFDQDLNTDDDVVFGSVGLPTGPLTFGAADFATAGDVRVGGSFTIVGRKDGTDRVLFEYAFNAINIGDDGYGAVNINAVNWSINGGPEGSNYLAATNDALFLGTVDLPINIDIGTGALNINGTPGVTNAAIVVDGVTLSFTKGILTGVA